MFARFRKTDYWGEVRKIEGFHQAVEKLGSNWKQLDEVKHGYTDINSIWGQLANLTELKNKGEYDARKWLYTAWHQNRQKVRTKFLAKMSLDQLPTAENETRDSANGQHAISNSKVHK